MAWPAEQTSRTIADGLRGESPAEIAFPLRKGGVVIGVLNVETADPLGLTEADLRLLTLIHR